LDLDLEADLGVDTVKQAEVFAAVRQRFSVERDDSLRLRDFPTLAHVIGWVRERIGTETGRQAAPEESPATDQGETSGFPRRVPVPVLRPEIGMCKPTGVTLGSGHRVVVMRDQGGVGKALTGKLRKLGCEVVVLDATDELVVGGTVDGVYWLSALDDEGPIEEMDLDGWREALRRRVKSLYAVAKGLDDQAPFLVVATRHGGYHGYDEAGALLPLGGAVTGFAKAYKREHPDVVVKAVDFPAGRKTAALAEALIEETLRDPGCVEVGRGDDLRWAVGLAERPFDAEERTLPGDGVFLITGAAGGIVSAITADLAAASGGTFHLLDLTPEPDPADEDLRLYTEEPEGLKAKIAVRLRERGERPTPVLIEKELAKYERLHTARAAIRAVADAGGTAFYHSVDLTDAEAVQTVMDTVRETSGRVDVLLHAAGLEVSHALPDKPAHEFDLVFDVKSDGWFNVMRAAGDMPIGTTVAFSSVAGRFGNAGQTDYSAANDLLCRLTSGMRRTRPGTRAVAVDWTAWAGIGMATRGSIPRLMEMAGIEMLPPETGVPWIRRELTASDDRGEVVVAGALGAMGEEFDETGGLDPVEAHAAGPMTGTVESAGIHSGLVVRVTLDPKAQPFLDHHRIDGTAVLPGVMGIEAFAEAAALMAPGRHVASVEDVDFLAPVKFYRDEPRTLTLRATVHRDGDDLLASCALEAERALPGSAEPQRTVHFTGSVRLTTEPPHVEREDPVQEGEPAVQAGDVYRLYFHGPAYQVVSAAWHRDGGAAASFARDLPAATEPADAPVLVPPRLVELCFQTAGLWESATYGRLALPRHIDRIRMLQPGLPGPMYATMRVEAGDEPVFDCAALDAKGEVILRVEGYRTIPLPDKLPAELRNSLAPVT